MMTKEEMIATYEALSAADSYIFGFAHNHNLYYVQTDKLPDELLKRDVASKSHGGVQKIRVRASSAMRAAFVDSGKAVLLGTDELLNANSDKYNKGERFEKLIQELLTGTTWQKDSVPFYEAGDIELNGQQVQIKFDGAELTNEKTLMRVLATVA